MSTAIPADLSNALYALKLVFQEKPIPTDRTPRMQRDDLIQELTRYGISLIQASKLIDHLVSVGVFDAHNPKMKEGEKFEAKVRTTTGLDGSDLGAEITPIRKITINRTAWELFIADKSELRTAKEISKSSADVPLDQNTIAAGQAMVAYVDSLAATNTAMRILAVDLGARHAGAALPQPGLIVTGKAGKLPNTQSDEVSKVVPAAALAEQTDPVSRAIVLLLAADKEGRPIKKKDLPKIVGCSRSTLYRDPQFQATCKALNAKKRANIPKGSKSREGIEAEYDPSEE